MYTQPGRRYSHGLASLIILASAGAILPGCGQSPLESPESPEPGELVETTAQAVISANNCTGVEVAPFVTPTFTRPSTDQVAFSSLLDGAGYAIDSNSDWVGIAGGNLCGGAEKELMLLKLKPSNFSVMRGPVPYAVGTGVLDSSLSHPWNGVAVGKLDAGAYDLVVAVRRVTASGVPDLEVIRVDATSCFVTQTVATKVVGGTAASDWVDVAIGNFDGTGNRIAMLRNTHPNLALVKFTAPNTLDVTFKDLEPGGTFLWQSLGAGDLNGDGKAELIAARSVGNGVSPSVIAYSQNASGTFQAMATSTASNVGNPVWAGMAVGDFNADGKPSIVLAKNTAPNFTLLSLAPGATTFTATTSNLDSAPGQDWRGVTAIDWLGGDLGATELVTVRKAVAPYRADLLVYGNPFHRVTRDTGLDAVRGAWDQNRDVPVTTIIPWMVDSHTNTVLWHLAVPGDYVHLVEFLELTKNFCVDGRHFRVQVTLVPPANVGGSGCSQPEQTNLTPWDDLADFDQGATSHCTEYKNWGTAVGRLAQRYPHLVALGMDDFGFHPDRISGDEIAEMESNMRSRAPWLSFVPFIYYLNLTQNRIPDLTRTIDSLMFFFRNEKAGQCLTDPCGLNSIPNAPEEIAIMKSKLPPGRRLQLGVYFVTLFSEPPQIPSTRYGYELVRLAMGLPDVSGITVYNMKDPPGVPCDNSNFLQSGFCTLWKNWGSTSCTPGQTQSCGNCGTQTCTASFTWGACSSQGVCSPGATNSSACGMCGTRTDTCSNSCQWVAGTCGNQGVCFPGESQDCCPCSGGNCACWGIQTCDSTCTWNSCTGFACGTSECP